MKNDSICLSLFERAYFIILRTGLTDVMKPCFVGTTCGLYKICEAETCGMPCGNRANGDPANA